jgi:hypothetical protein
MSEGIFGADIHAAHMETAKVRVWGFLLATATAAHKMLRCIGNARKRERSPDWKALRDPLNPLTEDLRRTRNFLEHLDEMVSSGEVSKMEECRFSRHGQLEYVDKKGRHTWSFTEESLSAIEAVWTQVITILQERNSASREDA